MKFILLLLLLKYSYSYEISKCIPITFDYCQNVLPYKITRYPNLAGDENEKDAINSIESYNMLVDTGCSQQLKFFLCSTYFPMCTDKVPIPIGPCRIICQEVHEKCEPVLRDFSLPWPSVLNCSRYPLENGYRDEVCMGDLTSKENKKNKPEDEDNKSDENIDELTLYDNLQISNKSPIQLMKKCDPITHVYINKTNRCVSQCYAFESVQQQQIEEHARYSLAIISFISLCISVSICFITIIWKWNKMNYFNYSLFFSIIFFSLASFVRLINIQFRDSISCTTYNHISIVVVPELHHIPCVLIAILTYYFGTTARLWSVIASFAWRRSLNINNKNEDKLEKGKFQFRTATIACTLTFPIILLILMTKSTNVDLTTGICNVSSGFSHLQNLFNSLREIVFLIFSLLPIFSGCLKEISPKKLPNNCIVSNSKPLLRNTIIVLFTILYFIFTTYWFYYAVQLFSSSSQIHWDIIIATSTFSDAILGIFVSIVLLLSIIINRYCFSHISLNNVQKINNETTVYLPTTLPPPPPRYILSRYGMQNNSVINDDYDNAMMSGTLRKPV
ncbi:Frizzled-4 [Strongyloides ratti]|uniref:Frizzled-4 n=1 Tax=Strongyloides ratti TaxID=34506 RepID=A0A090LHL4_STRRB|nr:Frizzled-4 [Strongyloides ratti]CEF67005.1 Frizzled-4 [Strongyloides ratti]